MRYKVMVVDDDQSTLDVMNLILQRIGYDPLIYRNGLDALDRLDEDRPDLILLDLQMLPIDGWEFLQKLREKPASEDIPVMLFTARPLIDDEREQADLNVVKVLEKPVTPIELKKELMAFFHQHQ